MSKIIILDDEPKIRKIYREALESKGYDIVEAPDWESVEGLLLQHPDTNLVLLDINLPSLQGDVIYSVLRLHDPKIRVIVSSVYPIEEQKRMVCRADAYFDKSEGVEYLLEKVRVVLGRNSPAETHL